MAQYAVNSWPRPLAVTSLTRKLQVARAFNPRRWKISDKCSDCIQGKYFFVLHLNYIYLVLLFATPLFRCVYFICFLSCYLTSFWCCTGNCLICVFLWRNSLHLTWIYQQTSRKETQTCQRLALIEHNQVLNYTMYSLMFWSLSHSTSEFICTVNQMLTSLSSSVSLGNNCCCPLIEGWQSFWCGDKRAVLHLQQRPASKGGAGPDEQAHI